MLKGRVKVETAIAVTKWVLTPLGCWPLSPNASYSEGLRRNIFWTFAILHSMACCVPAVYKITQSLDDPDIIAQVAVEFATMISAIIKITICIMNASRLQVLIFDMEADLKEATSEEMHVIQSYVDKCVNFHAVIVFSGLIGSVVYCLGPIVTSQPLPANTAYPFSIESFWIWATLYVSQALIITQVGCSTTVDIMFAILLWFSVARFEILSNELVRAISADDVKNCIKKHQILLRYVKMLTTASRAAALEVTAITLIAVTTGGLVFVRVTLNFGQNPPLFVLLKFIFVDIIAAFQLFLFTWPADCLKEMGERVGYSAYACSWIGKSREIRQHMLIVAQGSQISVRIAISGVLPELSQQFYGSILSAGFSYITTLRAMAYS